MYFIKIRSGPHTAAFRTREGYMKYILMNELVLMNLKERNTTAVLPDWVKAENLNQDERYFKLMYPKSRKKRS